MSDQFGTVDEAVLHVRRADAHWEAALQAFDAYPDRLRRLAEAAEQERKALLFAEVCSVRWRPLDAGPDFSLARDLEPGNRPGPDSIWTEFDQAVKQIGAALGGDGHAALAVTFGKLATAAAPLADKLEELEQRRKTG